MSKGMVTAKRLTALFLVLVLVVALVPVMEKVRVQADEPTETPAEKQAKALSEILKSENNYAKNENNTVLGADVLGINTNHYGEEGYEDKYMATTYFAGKPWYVIAYDGKGNGEGSGIGTEDNAPRDPHDLCAKEGVATLFSKDI